MTSADNANSWKKYPLFDEEYVIGKDKDCDIVFNHPQYLTTTQEFIREDINFL